MLGLGFTECHEGLLSLLRVRSEVKGRGLRVFRTCVRVVVGATVKHRV